MTLSVYLPVARRSPQQHAPLSTHQTVPYKVLLQKLCTTKFYPSTSLSHKVLLQYFSVPQSTTKYYSGTTVYYKVLLQYYSVLQSTTPVLVRILQRVYDGLMLLSSNFSVLKFFSVCANSCVLVCLSFPGNLLLVTFSAMMLGDA